MKKVTRYPWLVTLIVASIVADVDDALAYDLVYANYMAGNAYSASSSGVLNRTQEVALSFTVPATPAINYKLAQVEVTLTLQSGPTETDVMLRVWESNGLGTGGPTTILEETCVSGQMSLNIPTLVIGTFSQNSNLLAGSTYFIEVSQASPCVSGPQVLAWWTNDADVFGEEASRAFGSVGPWTTVSPNRQNVFRILGTPTPTPCPKPSYTAYATLGPAGANNANLHPEVFCSPNVLQNYCEATINIPAFTTSAQICQTIANGINTITLSDCFIVNGTSVRLFQASCSGNIVRVTNSKCPCPGSAYVCFDPAGITQFAKFGSYEHLAVGVTLNLRFSGTASGVAEDTGYNNSVHVVHQVREMKDSTPQIYDVELPLTAGMTDVQVAAATVAMLHSIGDGSATADGPMLRFIPKSETYDIAFRVNDSGLRWFMSPFDDVNPFEFFFGDPIMDIMPGKCPNRLREHGLGFLNVSLVSGEDFDACDVNLESLLLVNATDPACGGAVAPRANPRAMCRDRATPFLGELCDCHKRRKDGLDDMDMRFKLSEVRDALCLNELPAGTNITLCLTGEMNDGTPINPCDCVIK
ncbi:MAG: hypothetical protein O7D91_13880 [Planctomycetota bacterium]|nr:hypothetical protein [Planctomycetota bacterium]